jgi:NCAIR mutase (PurE)-related protein
MPHCCSARAGNERAGHPMFLRTLNHASSSRRLPSMNEESLRALLATVRTGEQTVDEAIARLRALPFEDLGFAKIDHHRSIRCGFPEVIYCEGKSSEQVGAIFSRCAAVGANVLATRASAGDFAAVALEFFGAQYDKTARTITLRQHDKSASAGTIAIVSAGTSDMPVAEEARITAEMMDQTTATFYDVGVAGLHRLLAHSKELQSASVAIVVAGMEGALASVVGGLVDCPVIAVPTSVGYGASFQGVAALLAMLNSCASGVTVVNIDNGFGAGYSASLINRLRTTREPNGDTRTRAQ